MLSHQGKERVVTLLVREAWQSSWSAKIETWSGSPSCRSSNNKEMSYPTDRSTDTGFSGRCLPNYVAVHLCTTE